MSQVKVDSMKPHTLLEDVHPPKEFTQPRLALGLCHSLVWLCICMCIGRSYVVILRLKYVTFVRYSRDVIVPRVC